MAHCVSSIGCYTGFSLTPPTAIVGVGEVPEGTNEPTTSLTEITNENEETAGMTNLFLTYILPSISAMVGCAMLVVVILSGCYIRRLKRRSSCVGVTMGGDPYSSTKYETQTPLYISVNRCMYKLAINTFGPESEVL